MSTSFLIVSDNPVFVAAAIINFVMLIVVSICYWIAVATAAFAAFDALVRPKRVFLQNGRFPKIVWVLALSVVFLLLLAIPLSSRPMWAAQPLFSILLFVVPGWYYAAIFPAARVAGFFWEQHGGGHKPRDWGGAPPGPRDW